MTRLLYTLQLVQYLTVLPCLDSALSTEIQSTITRLSGHSLDGHAIAH